MISTNFSHCVEFKLCYDFLCLVTEFVDEHNLYLGIDFDRAYTSNSVMLKFNSEKMATYAKLKFSDYLI
jgi:hypothetical protein